jgi:hypothetical protein
MRRFQDEQNATWVASVKEEPGEDYKGRYILVMAPDGGTVDQEMELLDVRWNSRRTAERTLRTMSETELRRRLHQAVGRVS